MDDVQAARMQREIDLLRIRLRELRSMVVKPAAPGDVHLLLIAHRLVIRAMLQHAKLRAPLTDADFRHIGCEAIRSARRRPLPDAQATPRVREHIVAEIRRILLDFLDRPAEDC